MPPAGVKKIRASACCRDARRPMTMQNVQYATKKNASQPILFNTPAPPARPGHGPRHPLQRILRCIRTGRWPCRYRRETTSPGADTGALLALTRRVAAICPLLGSRAEDFADMGDLAGRHSDFLEQTIDERHLRAIAQRRIDNVVGTPPAAIGAAGRGFAVAAATARSARTASWQSVDLEDLDGVDALHRLDAFTNNRIEIAGELHP